MRNDTAINYIQEDFKSFLDDYAFNSRPKYNTFIEKVKTPGALEFSEDFIKSREELHEYFWNDLGCITKDQFEQHWLDIFSVCENATIKLNPEEQKRLQESLISLYDDIENLEKGTELYVKIQRLISDGSCTAAEVEVEISKLRDAVAEEQLHLKQAAAEQALPWASLETVGDLMDKANLLHGCIDKLPTESTTVLKLKEDYEAIIVASMEFAEKEQESAYSSISSIRAYIERLEIKVKEAEIAAAEQAAAEQAAAEQAAAEQAAGASAKAASIASQASTAALAAASQAGNSAAEEAAAEEAATKKAANKAEKHPLMRKDSQEPAGITKDQLSYDDFMRIKFSTDHTRIKAIKERYKDDQALLAAHLSRSITSDCKELIKYLTNFSHESEVKLIAIRENANAIIKRLDTSFSDNYVGKPKSVGKKNDSQLAIETLLEYVIHVRDNINAVKEIVKMPDSSIKRSLEMIKEKLGLKSPEVSQQGKGSGMRDIKRYMDCLTRDITKKYSDNNEDGLEIVRSLNGLMESFLIEYKGAKNIPHNVKAGFFNAAQILVDTAVDCGEVYKASEDLSLFSGSVGTAWEGGREMTPSPVGSANSETDSLGGSPVH